MKKAVILLFVLLLLPIVTAQTITIMGAEYSVIVIAPLFFIILSMLFFFGMYIKDNIGSWKKFKLPEFKFKLKKKKAKKKAEKKEIAVNHLARFNLFKSKLYKLNNSEAFEQYSRITKEFFKDILEIPHEFTYSELKHIVKGNKKAVNLAEEISQLKYSGGEISKEKINILVKKLEPLIEKKGKIEEEVETGLIEKIKAKLLKLRKVKVIKAPKIEELKEGATNLEFYFSKIKHFTNRYTYRYVVKIKKFRVLNLIRKGEVSLSKDPELAKRLYSEALLEYYKLPIIEEKHLADKISKFHKELLIGKVIKKEFKEIPKKLLDLKHSGKQVSKEGLKLINKFKEFIEKEGLAIKKLHKLEETIVSKEKRKLHELEETVVKKEKGFLRKIKNNIKKISIERKKNYILNLIRKCRENLEVNVEESRRLYSEAVLEYYKLPVKKEKEVASELFNLHNEILIKKKHKKHLLDTHTKLLKLKHSDKSISREGINLISMLKVFIENEEKLTKHKLKRISKKLKAEEKKLRLKLYKLEKRILVKGLLKESLKEDHYKEVFKKPVITLPKAPISPLPLEEPFKVSEVEPTYHPKKMGKRLPKTLRTLRDERGAVYEKLDNLEKAELRRFKKQYYTKEIKKKPYVSKYQHLIKETSPKTSKEVLKLREEVDRIRRIIETS